ncbi:MAG: DsbA family protein [Alphaproteobacteria bacterium]
MRELWTTLRPTAFGFLGAVIAIAAWFILSGAGFIPGASSRPSDDGFEQRVRDYILANPHVIIEAVQRMETDQRVAETGELGQLIRANNAEILNDPATPVGGNPQGDVSLVEFFDYNCPYCRRVASTLIQIEESDPDLRIVYKEWPILGPNSEFAARAALAAHRQGKYVAFHKGLMLGSGLVDEARVVTVATEVGLDLDRLRQDMEAPEVDESIARNRALARVLRIGGTPAFVIGDRLLPGAADAKVIRSLIEQARPR